MILVDTSVWVAYSRGEIPPFPAQVWEHLAICGPVLQEVLQGLKSPAEQKFFRDAFASLIRLCDPLPESVFVEAAAIYSLGRRLGFTVRKSADCLIAAIAITSGAELWHRDRDFDTIARFTNLRLVPPTSSPESPRRG